MKNNITDVVLQELKQSLSGISQESILKMAEQITMEQRIFCDAAGRSRLQVGGFAMRLIQMGFQAQIVGEPTTPAITPGDVLFVCSASGSTPSLVEHARKARDMGVKLMLITANEASALSGLSDCKIVIAASSKQQKTSASIQPMGSLFEQSVGILMDIIVMHLMERYHITSDDMYRNHSNLE
ncbi:MAG: 6-phospho-3-hexuloisomerase [Enterocloster sp.]